MSTLICDLDDEGRENVGSGTNELPSNTLPLLLKAQQDIVVGAVDYKHRPAIRNNHGRWLSAFFIIWVEMAERTAYFGISGNLINFLTGKLGQSTAMAASQINIWSGVSCLLPILGGVIADSFLGKYYTILASSLIYLLGLGLLTLSTMLQSIGCNNLETNQGGTSGSGCSHQVQKIVFFVALYLVGLGQGGHKPCVQAFGADQFDEQDPDESKAKSSFFNWWYFGLSLGIMLGVSVMSYVQDNLSWVLGFGIPCIFMAIALLMFLLGTMTYRYTIIPEGESPCKRIGKVFVSAAKNWNATLPAGSLQFKFLDRALISCDSASVEESKALLRLFPIWATNLIFGIVFSQTTTLFTKQGMTLDRSIGTNFVIPAAAVQIFMVLCILIFIPIYDRVIVPIARKLTRNPSGLSTLQRIGSGLFISVLSMVAAAVIEAIRLETAKQYGLIDLPNVTIPMSIWWLLPQYILFGIAEAFTFVGLQEFFYDQVQSELRSVGLSLYLSIVGIGGLLSSVLVSFIDKVSSEQGESWFSDNLNRAHLDYFYWLLAGLSAIALALFVYYARSYIYTNRKASML